MQPSPADHRAAHGHECLVDVGASVESSAQSAELMEQGQRLFHHVSEDAKTAAMLGVAPRNLGGDAPARQLHSMRIGVVPAITHHLLRLGQRCADFPANRWDGIN